MFLRSSAVVYVWGCAFLRWLICSPTKRVMVSDASPAALAGVTSGDDPEDDAVRISSR